MKVPFIIKLFIWFFVVVGVISGGWLLSQVFAKVQETKIEEKRQELKQVDQDLQESKQVLEKKEKDLETVKLYRACFENGYYGSVHGVITDEYYDLCQEILLDWQKIAPEYTSDMD